MAETATQLGAPRQSVGEARTCVIIVNYKTSRHVLRCLESLEAEMASLPNATVVVVDNASGDDSVEFLRAQIAERNWGEWARVLASEVNGGFAAGNNLAVRENLASADPAEFFFLLNPDTWILPGAVRTLTEFMLEHPQAGVAGSRLQDPDGSSQASCFRFYNIFSEFNAGCRLGLVSKLLARHVTALPEQERTCEVAWVSGASMMVRREVFDSVGLMDETFFLYYEETDFQLRAHRAGWETWHVQEASVVHIMGQATGVTGAAVREKRRPRYWYESRRHFFQSNYGWLYAFTLDLGWFFGFSLWRLRRRLQRKPDTDPPGLWVDFLRYSILGLR